MNENNSVKIKNILILLPLFLSFLFLINFKGLKKEKSLINKYNKPKEISLYLKKELNIKESFDPKCKEYDPIYMLEQRINNKITLCNSQNSTHLCYINNMNIFISRKGIICKMDNFILDPSNWKDRDYIYKGRDYNLSDSSPLISKGLFNMKCDIINEFDDYDRHYKKYIDSWNYKLNKNNNDDDFEKNKEDYKINELSPGKIVFFISRDHGSANLFHGGSEFINAFSLLYLFDLNPEDIQIVFLESLNFEKNDPFYNLYKYVISGGNEPISIRNLKNKYHIKSAFHVPVHWDSPCYLLSIAPNCEYPTKTYYLLNFCIDKYLKIPNFIDFYKSDNETYYYPKLNNNNTEYKKYITIQWRRLWPKGRINQERLLGNGPELANKLASKLPNNILIRLVDTSKLFIEEQISIMKKTDYFIGVHGAGLFLSIFLPTNSIVHEIKKGYNMNGLRLMSCLSGHKTYSDIICTDVKRINNSEYLFFDENELIKSILKHMEENNFFSS